MTKEEVEGDRTKSRYSEMFHSRGFRGPMLSFLISPLPRSGSTDENINYTSKYLNKLY